MTRNLLSRGTFINYYNTFLCIAHSTTNFLHLATPLIEWHREKQAKQSLACLWEKSVYRALLADQRQQGKL